MSKEAFEKLPKEVQDALKDLFGHLKELHQRVDAKIKENYDPRPKSVGDRVMIWDPSFAQVVESKTSPEDYVNIPCIVAQERQSSPTDAPEEIIEMAKRQGEDITTLDLVVWCPKIQKHIRTMSRCVKLIN